MSSVHKIITQVRLISAYQTGWDLIYLTKFVCQSSPFRTESIVSKSRLGSQKKVFIETFICYVWFRANSNGS
jgi:hypothetical protein